MALASGCHVAHYRIERCLGAGGMGEVYLATDSRLDRTVAIKILPPEVSSDSTRLERFLVEAKAASALSHPNAAYVYEIGQDQGLHFLAMEYVEGTPLSTKVTAGPLPLAETITVAIQIAEALDAAHSRGIVHRDIKPANLIVTPRGHVKVLDFGLAKVTPVQAAGKSLTMAETRFATSAGAILGTVDYMSPEQALGHDVDARSDLFSLGVVIYQMITGRLPFAAATPSETIARILHNQPEAMARFNYDLPEDLDRIVRKCLEKDRERRYASARDLIVDLRSLRREPSAPSVSAAPRAGGVRAVIVDDEELARQILREFLSKCTDIEVVAECANGFEAVKAASEHKPDLLFLDVQMPKLDGFEVLELIDREIAVIFVTAFDSYAMKAFDAHAVDYLLKPFSSDRLQTAVSRARRRIGEKATTPPAPPPTELSAAARPPDRHIQRIVVKDGTRVHIIPVDKLDYAEAQDDYVLLRSDRKNYLKQQTISSLESSLDPERFLRIHRSYIVNLERVAKIEPYTKDTRVAVLTDGSQIPISRAGYSRLKEVLDARG